MDYDFVYGGDENAQRGDEKPKDANSWVTFTYVQDREFYEYSCSERSALTRIGFAQSLP